MPETAEGLRRPLTPRPDERVLFELRRLDRLSRPGCFGAYTASFQGDAEQAYKQWFEQIERAQIPLLLAAGPEEVNRIYDYVPRGLGLLVLGPKPRTIEEAVRLVVANLDWYVKPPRRLFRLSWVLDALSLVALTYCTIAFIVLFSGMFYPGADMVGTSILISVVLWVINSNDARRHYWLRSLLRYMEKCFKE